VANVACGFDVLGFALQQPGDTAVARRCSGSELLFSLASTSGLIPADSGSNTAGVAATEVLKLARSQGLASGFGIELRLHKELPIGSGMGSSAASAVAAALAVNALLERPFAREALLPCVMEAERVACGSAHADNVAPSLLGGFTLVRSYTPLDVIKLPVTLALYCALVHPQIEVRTSDARRILRQRVPLSAVVTQLGNIAGLVCALLTADAGLLQRSLVDVLVEPQRALLIPGFPEVKQAALTAGALGCSISGSGPSLFALCDSERCAQQAAQAMQQSFQTLGIAADVVVSPVGLEGAKVEACSW
jgi:homoserine kinase